MALTVDQAASIAERFVAVARKPEKIGAEPFGV
jgi:hypothetical protein